MPQLDSYELRSLVKRAAKNSFTAANVDRLIELATELKAAFEREAAERQRVEQNRKIEAA
jgi:hypothetical protein